MTKLIQIIKELRDTNQLAPKLRKLVSSISESRQDPTLEKCSQNHIDLRSMFKFQKKKVVSGDSDQRILEKTQIFKYFVF